MTGAQVNAVVDVAFDCCAACRRFDLRTEQIFVWSQIVIPELAVCVCDFSMFVNAPTIQELFRNL